MSGHPKTLAAAAAAVLVATGGTHALHGSACSGDFNGDGRVDITDLLELLDVWGEVSVTTVALGGNLDAAGAVADTGSVHETSAFYTDPNLSPGMEIEGNEA